MLPLLDEYLHEEYPCIPSRDTDDQKIQQSSKVCTRPFILFKFHQKLIRKSLFLWASQLLPKKYKTISLPTTLLTVPLSKKYQTCSPTQKMFLDTLKYLDTIKKNF